MSDIREQAEASARIANDIASAYLSGLEAAAERMTQVLEVAKLMSRLATFQAVLEVLRAQKAEVLRLVEESPPTLKALYEHQLMLLTRQEVATLCKIGVSPEIAAATVEAIDVDPVARERLAKRKRLAGPA